ncbi:MAG: hypothetical protein R3A44_00450 [Caldilineaceae bacterium]
MTAKDISAAIDRLKGSPIQSEAILDIEAQRFLDQNAQDERVQQLHDLRLRSERDVEEFARRISATANGIVVKDSEYGVLFFRNSVLRVKHNIYDASSTYLQLNLTKRHDRQLLTNHLAEMVKRYVQPEINLQVINIPDTEYSYLKLVTTASTPVYFRANSSSGWRILMWMNSGNEKWRVHDIDSSWGEKLFKRYLQIESQELEYQLKENEDELPSEKRLKSWKIRTVDDFVAFLLTELLDSDIDTRILATSVLSQLKTVKIDSFPQLARLLLGLVEDEIEIATRAIRLLGQFGNRQIYHFLLRNYDNYPELELRKAIVQCLGEISPISERKMFLELWQSSKNEDLRSEFNAAMTRIFERSEIPRFDHQTREEFLSRVFEGEASYLLALDFLAQERGNICSSYEHFGKIYSLLEFADLLGNMQMSESLDKLCAYREFDEGKDELSTQDWEAKIAILEKAITNYDEEEQRILVSLWKLNRFAERKDADGFVIQVARIVEPLLLYGLKKCGVVITERSGGYNVLEKEWVAENSEFLSNSNIQIGRAYDKQYLNAWFMRQLLKELLRVQTTSYDRDEKFRTIELIDITAPLAEARNRLSHEEGIISIEDFEQEFGSINDIFDIIMELFAALTEKELLENPIRNIPADVRSILERESLFSVSINMYEINNS